MTRKSPVNNDTWFKFLTKENLCGLCGNTGRIKTQGVLSPMGKLLDSIEGFCICPNGRSIAYIEKTLDKNNNGDSSKG